MALKDVRGYFRANQKEGRMFIIQGLVENMHQDVRTMTLVRGRLHDKKPKGAAPGNGVRRSGFHPRGTEKPFLKRDKKPFEQAEGPDGKNTWCPPRGLSLYDSLCQLAQRRI